MFGKITQKMGKILLTRCVFFMILNFFTKKQCPNLDVHCLYFMHFLQNKMNKYWFKAKRIGWGFLSKGTEFLTGLFNLLSYSTLHCRIDFLDIYMLFLNILINKNNSLQ